MRSTVYPEIAQDHLGEFVLKARLYVRYQAREMFWIARQSQHALRDHANHQQGERDRGIGVRMANFAAPRQQQITGRAKYPERKCIFTFTSKPVQHK
jgi:hypothetical protein